VSLQPPFPHATRLRLDGRSPPPWEAPAAPDLSTAAKRCKIWDLADTLHCSIVGTCLSTAELRHVLVRLKVKGAEQADEHQVHMLGVMLAGRREAGAKLLQRALDRRHGLSIKQYARAKNEEALLALWDESMRSGEIPGAYWALLSHPCATDAIVKKAFGDVHMLSHLVGAANRADIRRLRRLEEQIGEMTAKLERQQRQLRDGFQARDETIRRLNEMLAKRIEQSVNDASRNGDDERAALNGVIAELNRKLTRETAHRERLEQRLSTTSTDLRSVEGGLQRARKERDVALGDLAAVEEHIVELLQPTVSECAPLDELSGRTFLYVGGRTSQIPQMKALAERASARLLHHDGGIEHGAMLLPGLVSRADHVVFPVDCISHGAVTVIKKLCQQSGKSYTPLRTTSLASLLSALVRFGRPQRISAAPKDSRFAKNI
jgi:hypothetical protein